MLYTIISSNKSIMNVDVKKDGKNVVVSINNKERVSTEELSDQILNLERLGLVKVVKDTPPKEESYKRERQEKKAPKFGRGKKEVDISIEEPVFEDEVKTIEQENNSEDDN